MPQRFFIKDSSQAVVLTDKPFASGGEGELFDILDAGGRYRNHVAKLYFAKKRDAQRAAKIQFLLENPPIFDSSAHQPIVWVEATLCDENGNFVGFIMQRVQGEQLEILCAPKLPKYLGSDWQRLNFEHEDGLRLRAKICYNIAAAVHTIHATGKYVLVDLKPDNIILQSNGLISIVDMDSIEVLQEGKTLFPATVVTPDYTPAEYYAGVQPGKAAIDDSWDRFSMAVIFYRILFGIHPFAASSLPPYDVYTSLGDKIQHGLFVHNPDRSSTFSVIPFLHKGFFNIDKSLQNLFLTTFNTGHSQPQARVSAREWGLAFYNSSLLLVDRKLPSQQLVNKIIQSKDQNWYKLALEQASQELVPAKPAKTANAPRLKLKTNLGVWDIALPYYQRIGGVLWSLFKFTGALFVVLTIFLFVVAIATKNPGGALQMPISILSKLFYGLFFLTLRIPLIPLLAAIPLFYASYKKGGLWVSQSSDSWGDKFRKALNKDKLKKFLENKQYQLYTQRGEIKQRIQELRNQHNLWYQLRQKKEAAFYQDNKHLLEDSQQKIKERLQNHFYFLDDFDREARELFGQEAQDIRQLRAAFQNMLERQSPFADIPGNTWQDKKYNIDAWKRQQMGTTEENDAAARELLLNLQQLQDDLEVQTKEIRHRYEQKHAALADKSRQVQERILKANESATTDFRKESRLDGLLLNPKYLEIIKMQNQLESELRVEEQFLQELNKEIAEIKNELSGV